MLDKQFIAINKGDGVDKNEALIIARHYITIKTGLGNWNKLSNEIIDKNDHWLIHLEHVNNPRSTIPDKKLLIRKSDGMTSGPNQKQYNRIEYVEITGDEPVDDKTMIKQYEAINKKDGIDKDEAMIIARHYIQIESNLDSWNKLSDEIIDDNEHWLIDVIPHRITRNQQTDLKLLVDKSNGLILRQEIPIGEYAEKHKELIRRLEEQYEQMTRKRSEKK